MATGVHYWRLPTITMIAMLFLMFWLSLPEPCNGKPSWQPPPGVSEFGVSHCDDDSELLEICQRCAKATKSVLAYPMCCANYDNAINWCKDYLYFGIQ